MRCPIELLLIISAIVCTSLCAFGATPVKGELFDARKWVSEHFKQAPRLKNTPTTNTRLVSGLQVVMNYGPVQQNARGGLPLKIADKTYTRGLFTHARSKIKVHLPGPARAFTSMVGIDTNGEYTGGSVEFVVNAAGKELFRSPIMHRGEPAIPINVDLNGATDFVIQVTDAGDNFNSDQASWADARVTLNDGSDIWLGDMPILNTSHAKRSGTQLPFSFIYDGKSSDEILGNWEFRENIKKLDEVKTQRTLIYTDPATWLELKCVLVEYEDFPTVEWTLYFKNTGSEDTPIIENIQPLDIQIKKTGSKEFMLHHFIGSVCAPNDFQSIEAVLDPKSSTHIATNGGRPTDSNLPYFNIETGDGGVIAVVSWAGQWAVDFLRDGSNGVHITGGQELTHFILHPGEEVRTPMSVLQFYRGDWIHAQNIWRQWMWTHNIPKTNGKPAKPMASVCTGNSYPGIITNAAEEMHFLSRYIEEGIKPDYWWQDAGWYPCDPDGWVKTGTWEVEKTRWPKGIREVSDYCKSNGIKTIVWFEPERVFADTWLTENHPEWILGGKNGGLLNLGEHDCRMWLTNHIDRILDEQGIDLYRQDFNMEPLAYWRANDTEDRQGITEIKHVEGYFAYWDELIRRHPGMLIDSCASGGRRNDLETLRRALPLLRSDYTFEPVGEQCHTYGISFWMPFNGTGFLTIDPYLVRSQMSPEFTLGVDTRIKDQEYNLLRKLFQEWKDVSGYYYGDYYPLTPYSLDNNTWMAWQFDRPDQGEGMVQTFRRQDSTEESTTIKLQGLKANATYVITNLDEPGSNQMTGKELMYTGLKVTCQPVTALVFVYKKQ